MACFLFNKDNVFLHIPEVLDIEKVTFYNIVVKVGNVSWKVKHRYNDFLTLHEKLVLDHCVTKDILPAKKLIGKRDPAFIEKRRLGLETYLMTVVNFLKETMPRVLAVFLDFHKYDILFLLQEMSSTFFRDGDHILSKRKSYTFNPLQLHAISERLKQPCPPPEIFDRCFDFSHVLDFCCQLLIVEVEGSWGPVESSDIIPNKCAFELSVFKNVQELKLNKVSVGRIYDTGTVRHTLKKLTVNQCSLQSPADILLCDVVHKECIDEVPEDKKWLQLTEADFSQNLIEQFECSAEVRSFRHKVLTASEAGDTTLLVLTLQQEGSVISEEERTLALNQSNVDGLSLLQSVSRRSCKEIVWILLENGANPCTKDSKAMTAYDFAPDKETRNTFRRFMGQFPDKYDYSKSHIPSALTDEIQKEAAEKKRAQKKAKREKEREKRIADEPRRQEEAERKRYLELSDREKRALAAERRMLAAAGKTGLVLTRCYLCAIDITGKVPFTYENNVFCSMPCLKAHRMQHKPS